MADKLLIRISLSSTGKVNAVADRRLGGVYVTLKAKQRTRLCES